MKKSLCRLAVVGVLGCSTPSSGIVEDGAADAGVDALHDGAETSAACVDPAPRDIMAGPAPIEALRGSQRSLMKGWKFKLAAQQGEVQPWEVGEKNGYFEPDFVDSGWKALDAGRAWESTGEGNTLADYWEYGWYRVDVDVPKDWEGSAIQLESMGIDDEFDVYVNGHKVKHWGWWDPNGDKNPSDRISVHDLRTNTRIEPYLKFGQRNQITIKVIDWGGSGGIMSKTTLHRILPMTAYETYLPNPVIDGQPELRKLYWAAWQMAWDKVSFGTKENGLADSFMDEGFNEQIYQWDTSFICMFARYGLRLFPVMASLDNFYGKQEPSGYIQRVYSETTGARMQDPTAFEPGVNPPLFSWVEYQYYQFSGDSARLSKTFPNLLKYHTWLAQNLVGHEGLYYQTGLGSGMDNTPRSQSGYDASYRDWGNPHDARVGAWVDMSIQQALSAYYLSKIAGVIGDEAREGSLLQEYRQLKTRINDQLWDAADGFYYDLGVDDQNAPGLTKVKHIGAFWALLAGALKDDAIADQGRTQRLVEHLRNPDEFHRPHLFPTLAKDQQAYSANGHYWLGAVWAPTNYVTIKGLAASGHGDFAREAALNHIQNMSTVFDHPPTDGAKIYPNERKDDYQTIWECYSAEAASPCTRWDDTYHGRQDFVGWSGLGPIALLIEQVLGFEIRGAENRVVWNLTRTDRHGVERMQVGPNNVVSIIASARGAAAGPTTIQTEALRSFTLEVILPNQPPKVISVCAGTQVHELH